MLREIRYRLRGAALPVIFMALTGYFGWNAIHGQSGLEAQVVQREQLQSAQTIANTDHSQLLLWQTRVAALSNQSVQPDMLDEQAREVLNLADPADLVVDLPANQKF